MPIHKFGPLKRIEDAEKEVEEGKAKEINRAKKVQPTKSQVQKEPKKPKKKEVKKTSHPLIHGTLDIEEEEL